MPKEVIGGPLATQDRIPARHSVGCRYGALPIHHGNQTGGHRRRISVG